QPLTQLSGAPAPQCLERHMLVAQFVDRQREEGKGTARLEVDPYDRRRLAGVEDEEPRVGAGNDRLESAAAWSRQVDHELDRAGRQHALAGVRGRGVFVEPQKLDKIRQRAAWRVMMDHCADTMHADDGCGKVTAK